MKENNKKYSIITNRPILLMANSSWYLNHYRSLLIKKISLNNKLFTMSPIDKYSNQLSESSIYIPLRIQRSNDLNPFSLIFSFLKILLIIRAIKPKLIHSHTLKTNLLAVLVSSLYGLPCVLSFAGMGRLSKSKGINLFLFKKILYFIYNFSIRKRDSRWTMKKTSIRSFFIFQNPIDLEIFKKYIPNNASYKYQIIPGSGVPSKYLLKKNSNKNKWLEKVIDQELNYKKITFIYCGRLLKSKGIYIFLDLLKEYSSSKGLIFGDIDPSSKDSLSSKDLDFLSKSFKNVIFHGNIQDPLLNITESFPILIVPSDYGEGLSRSILEALSLRIPVISSKSSLCGIFNSDYLHYAELNNYKNYMDVVGTLIKTYKNNKLRVTLKNGFKKVVNEFTEQKIVDSTISIYDDLLDKNNSSYLISKRYIKESFWLAQ